MTTLEPTWENFLKELENFNSPIGEHIARWLLKFYVIGWEAPCDMYLTDGGNVVVEWYDEKCAIIAHFWEKDTVQLAVRPNNIEIKPEVITLKIDWLNDPIERLVWQYANAVNNHGWNSIQAQKILKDNCFNKEFLDIILICQKKCWEAYNEPQ